MTYAADVVAGERARLSAAGPASNGAASAENVRGQVVDPAAAFVGEVAGDGERTPAASLALFCSACFREHQPRERAVGCRVCRRMTFDVHAICPSCRAVGADT